MEELKTEVDKKPSIKYWQRRVCHICGSPCYGKVCMSCLKSQPKSRVGRWRRNQRKSPKLVPVPNMDYIRMLLEEL